MPFIIVGALIVGLMLGLMGSGGSILTVPTLVYFLGHDDKIAIAESLAIVGAIATVTMLPYAKAHLVSWRNVLFFGIPGMAGTYLGAWLSSYVAGAVQLILFGSVMFCAAVLMFRRSEYHESDKPDTSTTSTKPLQSEKSHKKKSPSFWLIGLEGISVGIITGLVGVGGGFLIVPALVMLSRLPMRTAVGTSLAVIVMNSISGFYKHSHLLENQGAVIDWTTVAAFVVIGIAGSFLGHAIATRLNQNLLRRGFALFLVMMGIFVFANEIPKLFHHDAQQPEHSVASDSIQQNVFSATLQSGVLSANGSSNNHGVSR